MSKLTGLVRLGRTAEIRYLGNGDAVTNLALVYNYGKKGEDGNRPSQWVEAALFGKRAEQLAPFLLKGNQIVAVISDIHIETYRKGDGSEGFKLVGRIDDIELTDRKDGGQSQSATAPQRQAPQGNNGYSNQRQQPQQRQQAAPAQRQAPQGGGSGFDDMDDDIPFASSSMSYDMTTSKSKSLKRCDF